MLTFNDEYIPTKIRKAITGTKYQKSVDDILKKIKLKTLPGVEMLGWVDLITNYNNHLLTLMHQKAKQWQNMKLDYVLVIGIGGSYVGVKAGVDFCTQPFDQSKPKIIWVSNISATFLCSLQQMLAKKQFAIIATSRSGTTLEPALAFHLFREQLEKQVGVKSATKLITVITSDTNSNLYKLAKNKKYTIFPIPADVGGRFSTLSPVGMFPMMIKNIDALALIRGASQALKDTKNRLVSSNSAFRYACYRHYFRTKLKLQIENFIVYDPNLVFCGEMWRQIFGESEGKENKGLFPTLQLFTTDLHSMGQYLQEGTRNFFETTLLVEKPLLDTKLKITSDIDKLHYLNNRSLDFINKKAFEGTVVAHSKLGKSYNLIINLTTTDSYHFGYLFIWLAMAVTISGYLLKINPFNQPGVEAYKKNMQILLKK